MTKEELAKIITVHEYDREQNKEIVVSVQFHAVTFVDKSILERNALVKASIIEDLLEHLYYHIYPSKHTKLYPALDEFLMSDPFKPGFDKAKDKFISAVRELG